MMLTDYIWDFDGMLFDTYPHIVTSFIEASRRLGREAPEYGEAFELFSVSYGSAYSRYKADSQLRELFHEIESDIGFPPCALPFPGIPEALSHVVTRGGRNFVYSHRDKTLFKYLDKYALTDFFTGFITSDDSFPLKPAPDAIEYLIRKYSIKKEAAVMIGDRAIDVLAGANAGIASCLFDKFGNLEDVPCTFYVRSTEDIIRITED